MSTIPTNGEVGSRWSRRRLLASALALACPTLAGAQTARAPDRMQAALFEAERTLATMINSVRQRAR